MIRHSTTSVTVVGQVGRMRDWTNLGTLLGVGLHEREKRDPLRFYEALVNFLSNLMKQKRYMIPWCLTIVLSIVLCQKVLLKKAPRKKAAVFPSKFDVSIQFLLWLSVYCRYSFEFLGISCPCMVNKKLKERIFLGSWILLQAPSLLVIYTDRGACGNGRKLLTTVLNCNFWWQKCYH